MLYLIGGENTYESSNRVNELRNSFIKSHPGTTVKIKNADDIDSNSNFFIDMTSISMFVDTKIFIIKRALKNKDQQFQSHLENFINSDWKNLNLIFWEDGKVDKRGRVVKLVSKLGNLEEFSLLKPFQLKSWINKYIKSKNLKISNEVVDELVLRSGAEQTQLSNVIDIIAVALKQKNSNTITKTELENFAPQTAESSIWNLIDAVSIHDTYQSMSIIEEIVHDQSSFALAVSMINRQLRLITQVKLMQDENLPYNAIQSTLKIHPFVLQKIVKTIDYFSMDKLKVLYKKLLDADIAVKSGKFTPKLALDLFVTVI